MQSLKVIALGLAFVVTAVLANGEQLRQVATVEIPGPPGFGAAVFSGKYLLLAHTAANTLDVVDPALRRVVAQVKNLPRPRALAVDEQNGIIYVADAGNNSIAVVSADGWKFERSIQLKSSPDCLALAPDRQALYVCHWDVRALSAVDLPGGQERLLPLDGIPQGVAFDQHSGEMFVSLQGNPAVAVLDKQLAIVKRFAINAAQPTGIAFNPQDGRLYLAVRQAVLVLNPQNGAELARVPAAPGADTLLYDPAAHSLYVTGQNGEVNLIQGKGGDYHTEDVLKTAVRGAALALGGSGNFIYLSGGREGHSKLAILKLAPGQGLHPGQKQPTTQVAQRTK